MKALVVGLGNPGNKYQATRHNVGFMVLETLLRKLAPASEPIWEDRLRLAARVARVGEIIFAQPTTFMNASGGAVAKLLSRFHLRPAHLYVVHDEVDLPLGEVKISVGRGPAGHRGVASIIHRLGQGFTRVRVGIGRSPLLTTEEHVLKPLSPSEADELKQVVDKAAAAVETVLRRCRLIT